jgi:hypothetical protein
LFILLYSSIIASSIFLSWNDYFEVKVCMDDRNVLLRSLAATISDYRRGEIAPITPAHVERWLNQFDPADQPVILAEMDSLVR